MHTDKPLYLLLGADSEFLHLLSDGLRIEGPYQIDAIDLKSLERRIDGVIVPEDTQQPIWAIEVQAQYDASIYHRILVDMGLLGTRHPKREIRGLLIFISAAQDPKTEPWQSYLTSASTDFPIRRVYLLDIFNRLEQQQPDHPLLATFLPYRLEDREQLREQAPLAYSRIQQAALPDLARRHCLDVFQSWLLVRFNDLTLEEVLTMLGELTPLEQTRAYREIVEKNQPIWFAEGQEEGRQSEAAQLICRQLHRRIGALTEVQQEQIKALPVEPLEDLGEALLDFTAAADLDAWLSAHRR